MGIETAAIVVAAVGAATTVYSTVQQNRAQKKAAGAQEDAAETAAAQQKAQEAEARRQEIRKQRIRSAQIQQAAANTGVAMSSGELGSLSALSTNASSNLAFMSGTSLANQGISQANQQSMNYQGKASTWGAIGSIASSVTNLAVSTPQFQKGVSDLFGGTSNSNQSKIDNLFA